MHHHFLTIETINRKAAEDREQRLRIFWIAMDKAAKAIAARTDTDEASIKDQIEVKLDLAITTFYGQNQEMPIRYRAHLARLVKQKIIDAPEDLITYIDEFLRKRSPCEWRDNSSSFRRPKTMLYLTDDQLKDVDKKNLTDLLDRYEGMLLLIAQDENEKTKTEGQEVIGIKAEQTKTRGLLEPDPGNNS